MVREYLVLFCKQFLEFSVKRVSVFFIFATMYLSRVVGERDYVFLFKFLSDRNWPFNFLLFFYIKYLRKGGLLVPQRRFSLIFKAVVIDSLYSCRLFFLLLMITPSLIFLSVVHLGAFVFTFFSIFYLFSSNH